MPAHEVHYEQSIVAPLLSLLLAAYRLQPTEEIQQALEERLPWLLAFAGEQPHVRLRHIGIRHWDGYWFGRWRQWGDVFPHYWSALIAEVLLAWPELEGTRQFQFTRMARAILEANLSAFRADGSATCAFIYPSCVDGNPAYHADPLANDQDWALVIALNLLLRGVQWEASEEGNA